MPSKIILAGIGVSVIAAGGGAGYFFYLKPAAASTSAVAQKTESAKRQKLAYVDVKELTLRLADTSEEHYLKLTAVVAVPAAEAETFPDKAPVVRDKIVSIITGRKSTELSTPDGQQKLKRDILAALKQEFPDDVTDLYFSGYLIE